MVNDRNKYNSIESDDFEEVRFFDPKNVVTRTMTVTVDSIIRRIEKSEIDMSTNFQRHQNLWTDLQQSRLIESILIRFPLPAFYFDASDQEKWLIIDGLQRLNTLYRFIYTKNLKLRGLEFFPSLENMGWDDLSRSLQRQLLESPLFIYVIEVFDKYLRYSLFLRINTGGLMFNSQEIRHAIFHGAATDLIEKLSQSHEFIQATGGKIDSRRMDDRYFVTRFLAFYLLGFENYKYDFDSFLNEGLQRITKISFDEIGKIESVFREVMTLAFVIFGKDTFRKINKESSKTSPINRALFDVVSVTFARLNPEERSGLRDKKNIVYEQFADLFLYDDHFSYSLSKNNRNEKIYRFERVKELINDILR